MIYYIILVLIILGLVWVVWKSYQHNEADKKEILAVEKERDEYVDLGKGLAEYNQKLIEKKNQSKDKILNLFTLRHPSAWLRTGAQGAQARVSNHDVAKALNISSATAVRYLDELEKEGKVKQVGRTGKKVFYTL
jgi:predicted HTH transcriptional regulator